MRATRIFDKISHRQEKNTGILTYSTRVLVPRYAYPRIYLYISTFYSFSSYLELFYRRRARVCLYIIRLVSQRVAICREEDTCNGIGYLLTRMKWQLERYDCPRGARRVLLLVIGTSFPRDSGSRSEHREPGILRYFLGITT